MKAEKEKFEARKSRLNSWLNNISQDMDDKTKIYVILNTLAELETKILQHNECLSGSR